MRDLPARRTCPSANSTGAVVMSRSFALSDAQLDGAKNCSSRPVGVSSSTESLSSYAWPGSCTEPFPTLTHTLPRASTTGAAPPIQTAPWLSPARSSTVKMAGLEPPSSTEITRPRYVAQSP